MLSRKFFIFGAEFNILKDTLYCANNKTNGATPPPTENDFLLSDGSNFLLSDGTNFLLS
jgi:hypothetical protein